jgi:pyruvate ferredoxin oxidoreductase alpha subunit
MGPTIGVANRNHRMMILEYDNQGYMNTGAQLSYSTPMGHRTSTSNVGPAQTGKQYHHKDTLQIMAATHIPFVFSATEGFPQDLIKKAAKAQWYANHEGLVYGKVLSFCPLNWRLEDDVATEVAQAAPTPASSRSTRSRRGGPPSPTIRRRWGGASSSGTTSA